MSDEGKKSQIASAYNAWAETYDRNQNRTRDLAGEVLRRVDLGLNGRNIIEVGCGTGRNTQWLAGPLADVANILALDFSEEMLARARARVDDQRVRFIQHDVRFPWPVTNAAADVVIAMLILEHVEHLEPFFAEAAKALKADGKLFICELHPMRQLLGGQAQFTSAQTGERQLVDAFLHNVSDYVNVGLSSGFELANLGEWRDADAAATDLPRLLSLLFRRRVS